MLTAGILQIADERMNGATLQEIASKEGVHESTISRKLSRPEVKAYLESIHQRIITEGISKATENLIHAVDSYKTKDADHQLKEHGFKASLEVSRSIGLLPSHTLAPQITTILNVQNNQYITPVVMKAIKLSLASSELELPKYEKPVMVIDSNELSG